jgi:hypothetical protein
MGVDLARAQGWAGKEGPRGAQVCIKFLNRMDKRLTYLHKLLLFTPVPVTTTIDLIVWPYYIRNFKK